MVIELENTGGETISIDVGDELFGGIEVGVVMLKFQEFFIIIGDSFLTFISIVMGFIG